MLVNKYSRTFNCRPTVEVFLQMQGYLLRSEGKKNPTEIQLTFSQKKSNK